MLVADNPLAFCFKDAYVKVICFVKNQGSDRKIHNDATDSVNRQMTHFSCFGKCRTI